MNRLIRILLLPLCLVLLSGAGITRPASWSDEQKADLDTVSAYLNAVQTMTGSFVQIGPDGSVAQGRFFISKPGKMRFDYNPPSPTMVVSNGLSITVYNTQLKTQDSYPLSSTPLNLLLSNRLKLASNKDVVGIERQDGQIIVHARSNDRRATGNITIVFSGPDPELKQWTIVDGQGLPTTVTLRDVQTGTPVPLSLFGLKDKG